MLGSKKPIVKTPHSHISPLVTACRQVYNESTHVFSLTNPSARYIFEPNAFSQTCNIGERNIKWNFALMLFGGRACSLCPCAMREVEVHPGELDFTAFRDHPSAGWFIFFQEHWDADLFKEMTCFTCLGCDIPCPLTCDLATGPSGKSKARLVERTPTSRSFPGGGQAVGALNRALFRQWEEGHLADEDYSEARAFLHYKRGILAQMTTALFNGLDPKTTVMVPDEREEYGY